MRIAFSSFIRSFEKSVRTENWLCSHSAKPVPTGSNIRQRRDSAGYSRSAQCDCSPVPGAPGNSGSDRRKFEPNTAIADKQSYLRAHILYLSTHDRCELFRCCALSVPCSLGRSSRNRTSSLSVSLGLGIRPVAFCHRPSFCLEYRLSPFQDAEVALWSNHGRRLKAAVLGIPPQFQVTFLNPNLMALDYAPT